MAAQIINNLKTTFDDPQLVVKIQQLFGVVSYDSINENPIDGKSVSTTTLSSTETSYNTQTRNRKQLPVIDRECDAVEKSESNPIDTYKYKVQNKFWYCIFLCSTYLGDEVGYALFIPYWIWNVDVKIGRRFVVVWTISMYIGQSLKDIIKWPRPPSPPVVRLQKKWALEYGMPSTHAIVGVVFPSCAFYYCLQENYHFSIPIAIGISFMWCSLISMSRLYLGMHSVLDILIGLFLASIIVIPTIPLVGFLDSMYIKSNLYPPILFVISILLILVSIKISSYTHALADTSTILAATVGINTGCFLNLRIPVTDTADGYFTWNEFSLEWNYIAIILLRELIGLSCLFLSFASFDFIFDILDNLLFMIGIEVRNNSNKKRIPPIHITYKYISFLITTFHITCSIPYLFKILSIGRKSYYNDY